MKIDEREHITREIAKKEALHIADCELLDSALNFGIFAFAYGFVAMTAHAVLTMNSELVALQVFLYLLGAAVNAFPVYRIIKSLAGRIGIMRGGFEIVTDELKSITKDQIHYEFVFTKLLLRPFNFTTSVLGDELYFDKHGEVYVKGKVSEYSNVGDKFYLVTYGKNNRVARVYNSRMYRI
ncbi:MAG: hypothetical protein IJN48_01270 [Clostridia bacterium]|nr:hypothetical protein [Clostridia bacterium]